MLVGGQEFYTFSDSASHEKGNFSINFFKIKVFIWDFREAAASRAGSISPLLVWGFRGTNFTRNT